MLIIGIDPGVSGSICFLKDGKILDVIEMPVMNEGKKIKNRLMELKFTMKLLKKLIAILKLTQGCDRACYSYAGARSDKYV